MERRTTNPPKQPRALVKQGDFPPRPDFPPYSGADVSRILAAWIRRADAAADDDDVMARIAASARHYEALAASGVSKASSNQARLWRGLLGKLKRAGKTPKALEAARLGIAKTLENPLRLLDLESAALDLEQERDDAAVRARPGDNGGPPLDDDGDQSALALLSRASLSAADISQLVPVVTRVAERAEGETTAKTKKQGVLLPNEIWEALSPDQQEAVLKGIRAAGRTADEPLRWFVRVLNGIFWETAKTPKAPSSASARNGGDVLKTGELLEMLDRCLRPLGLPRSPEERHTLWRRAVENDGGNPGWLRAEKRRRRRAKSAPASPRD